jgi:hypothetical protein
MNAPINVEVKRILSKRPVARTAFQRIHVKNLKESCQLLGLVVNCSGKRQPSEPIKADYADALVNYVRAYFSGCLPYWAHIQGNSTTRISEDGEDISQAMDVDCKEEIVSQEAVQQTKVIRIRLYKQPRDWNAVCEINFCCGSNGEVNLEEVGKELGIEEPCRVCFYIQGISSQLNRNVSDNRPQKLQTFLSV